MASSSRLPLGLGLLEVFDGKDVNLTTGCNVDHFTHTKEVAACKAGRKEEYCIHHIGHAWVKSVLRGQANEGQNWLAQAAGLP